MALVRYDPAELVRFLEKNKIGTMDDFKKTLGTTVDLTVFRKLQPLGYRASYSHHGKYYTLYRLASFDEAGLWVCAPARFSREGTLLETVKQFVEISELGHSAGELQGCLGVSVKEPLLKLVRERRLNRELIAGLYMYGSVARGRRELLEGDLDLERIRRPGGGRKPLEKKRPM